MIKVLLNVNKGDRMGMPDEKIHALDVKLLSLNNRSRSYSKLLGICCLLYLFLYGQIVFAVKDTEI